jgi:hypothetical protein
MLGRGWKGKRINNHLSSINPSFFDLSEYWRIDSFYKKKKQTYFLFKPKSHPQKNYRVTNFSVFHDFYIILYLITQRVFIVKTISWVRWKGILLKKIQKIKNPTTTLCKIV